MIDTKVEIFSPEMAISSGLMGAILRGDAKISGSYEITKATGLRFKQNKFAFVDKYGALRVGKFGDGFDFIKFYQLGMAEVTDEKS